MTQASDQIRERLHERITTGPMADRIRAAALALAYRYQTEHDDIEQDIVEAILQQAERDPAFTDQADAHIVKLGEWRARDAQRRELCLGVNARSVPYDPEATPDPAYHQDPWPAVSDRLVLRQAISRISPRLQQVARVILSGASPTEAAALLRVRSSAFYERRQQLIEALAKEMRP